MKENNVPYDLKSACGWIYSGKNESILACWDGCIEGNSEAGSCDSNIAIPKDYDYCMLKKTVKRLNENEVFECLN